jgi:hypothetical protein
MLCTTGAQYLDSLAKIDTLGYASCDNSSPLGGKVALYSFEAEITIKI